MALIKCTNCGRPISDKAKTCPHCGALTTSTLVVSQHEDAPVRQAQGFLQPSPAELEKEQQQIRQLKEEASLLQNNIASEKQKLEQLKIDTSVAEANLEAQQQTLKAMQLDEASRRRELDQLNEALQDHKAELNRITEQIASAKGVLQHVQQPSLGYRLAVWLLCIAIVATLAWIVWMVVNTQ